MGCCEVKLPRNQVQMNKIYSNSTSFSQTDPMNSHIERRSQQNRKTQFQPESKKIANQILSQIKPIKSPITLLQNCKSEKASYSKTDFPQAASIRSHDGPKFDDSEPINNSDIHIEVEEEPQVVKNCPSRVKPACQSEKHNESFETKTSNTEIRRQKFRQSFNQGICKSIKLIHFDKSPRRLEQFGKNDLNLRETFVPIKCYSDNLGFKTKKYEAGLSVISQVISGVDTDNQKRSSIIVSQDQENEKNFTNNWGEKKSSRSKTVFGPKPKKLENFLPNRGLQSQIDI